MNINISGEVVRTSQLPKRIIGLGDYLVALNSSPLETSTVLVSDFVSFLNTQFATSLASLTDVSINGPLVGQALVYNGSQWVNQGIGELDTLNSVTTRGNSTTNSITVGGVYSPYLRLDTVATPTLVPGMFAWNDADGTANLRLKGNNVTLQLGQETVAHVVNKTGADLLESQYKVVRVRVASEGGSQGQRLAVVLAQGDNDPDSATTLGVVTENIGNNQEGFITILGNVNNINTTGSLQGETWVDGDVLYLSPITPGSLTKVKPVAPQHTLIVGYVVYAHQNNGKIFVKVDNGYELDELHNVLISSPANNDLLQYNSTQQVWKNIAASVAVPTPTLAQVTTAGNTTTNAITVGGLTVGSTSISQSKITIESSSRSDIILRSSGSLDDTFTIYAFGGAYGSSYAQFGTNDGVSSLAQGGAIYTDSRGGVPPIRFMVKGTGTTSMSAAMSVYTTTNIGIGTTTDAGYKLDVNGTARVNNTLSITGQTSNNYLVIGTGTGNANFQWGSYYLKILGVKLISENIVADPSGTATTVRASAAMDVKGYLLADSAGIGTGTTATTAKLTVAGSITASSALAQGVLFNNTLVAAANNDVLVGLDIQPTFTNGAFTGTRNIVTRFLAGTVSGNNGAQIAIRQTDGTGIGAVIGTQGGGWNALGFWGADRFPTTGTPDLRIFSTGIVRTSGNFIVDGNARIGTTTDSGYKLDVNGITRLLGTTLINPQLNITAGTVSTQLRATAYTLQIRANDASVLSAEFFQTGNVAIGPGSDTGYKLNVTGNNYNTFVTNAPFQVDTSANNYRIANLINHPGYHAGGFTNNTFDLFSVGANSSSTANGSPFFRVNLAGGSSTGYYGAAGQNQVLAQLNGVTTATLVLSAQGSGMALIITTIAQGANLNLRSDVNGSYAGGGINYYASINGSQHSHVWYFNGSEQMRLMYTGNLLIGTSTDSGYKLDVNGSFISRGNAVFVSSLNTSSFFSTAGIHSDGRMALYGTTTDGTIQLLAHRGANSGGSAALFPGSVNAGGGLTGAIGLGPGGLIIQAHTIGTGGINAGTHKSLAIGTPNTSVGGFGGVADTIDFGTYSCVSNSWSGIRPAIRYTALSHEFRVDNTTGQFNPGTSALYINSSANIGIGTTTPTGRNGYDGATALEIVNNTAYASLNINGGNISAPTYLTLGAQGSGADIRVNNKSLQFTINSVDALKIATTGNVLINTVTDAGYKLDVNGTTRVQVSSAGVPNILHISNLQTDAGPGGAIAFYTGGGISNASRIVAVRSGTSGQSDIGLETTGVTRLFVAANSGNVGIGTTTPVSKLNVYGGDIISSSATANRTTKLNDVGLYISRTSDGTYPCSITGDGGMIYDARNNHTFRSDTVTLLDIGNAHQNVTIGASQTSGARLVVKGSGSTSATSSLLVQNSSSTTTLRVNDAGTVTTGGDIFAGNIQMGKGSSTGIYNVAIGQYVLAGLIGSSTVSYTTTIGQTAGGSIASGLRNVIIGAEVAKLTGVMSNSVIIGAQVFQSVTSSITDTLAIGTGNNTNYYPTIYATNIASDSPNVRIGNNSAAAAAIPTAPTASAILELSSTTQGFLPPRLTTAEILLISSPAEGLQVYNTDLKTICFYNGTAWQRVTATAM